MAIIMDFAQTFRHGHQTTLHLAVFYKKIRNFPGFFPDFPGFPGFYPILDKITLKKYGKQRLKSRFLAKIRKYLVIKVQ